MRSLSRTLLISLFVVSLLAPHASPAAALSSRTGRVVAVNDGDTFDVDFNGDGAKDARVRMLGIQAMELTDYVRKTGQCHAPEAYRRLRDLVLGKTVRLTAKNPGSVGLKGRIQRFVAVHRDGAWRDVGTMLLREGHALWFPHQDEYSKNAAYQRASRAAQDKGVGLWNRDKCGAGPDAGMRLRLAVKWDADGADNYNVNGEWIKITNAGSRVANISGWVMRDSALRETHSATAPLRQYRFPSGTTILPQRAIYLHVGRGAISGSRYYWNQSDAIFENWENNGRNLGDGAYLFDPHGDIRAHHTYPCLQSVCR